MSGGQAGVGRGGDAVGGGWCGQGKEAVGVNLFSWQKLEPRDTPGLIKRIQPYYPRVYATSTPWNCKLYRT